MWLKQIDIVNFNLLLYIQPASYFRHFLITQMLLLFSKIIIFGSYQVVNHFHTGQQLYCIQIVFKMCRRN